MFNRIRQLVAVLCAAGAMPSFAQTGAGTQPPKETAGQTVRIAFMDPLSGPFGNVGANQLKTWQLLAKRYSGNNNPAGVMFEVVGFDNKGSPQESLNTLKAAIGKGFRYVTQGNGSGAALAISGAVDKHNERNSGSEVIYLNYAAVDPSLTNDRCSYWHFRFDADTSMKMEALTALMKEQSSIKKVYVIGQNYAHGQQVSRYFKNAIARKRPDIQVVGDDLHPIGQVKDFSPYAAKIKASGADAIVTGNWGQDLTLLVKALNDSGSRIPLFTYYASGVGVATALSAGTSGDVYVVSNGHFNHAGEMGRFMSDFNKTFDEDNVTHSSYHAIKLLGTAIAKARSTNPIKVAKALEGLEAKSFAGHIAMRPSDHQLQQTMFISRWQPAKPGEYRVDKTAYTWASIKEFPPYVSTTPTSCQMKRPGS